MIYAVAHFAAACADRGYPAAGSFCYGKFAGDFYFVEGGGGEGVLRQSG